MTNREFIILGAAAALVLLALSAMYSLHERHYRTRGERIATARRSGSLDARLECIEAILAEDRLT